MNDPNCPICLECSDLREDCPHFLAEIDRTFGEARGIEDEDFEIQEMLNTSFSLAPTAAGYSNELLNDVFKSWIGSSVCNADREIDELAYYKFLQDLLVRCGAKTGISENNDAGGPGFSSDMDVLYAENTNEVLEMAVAWVKQSLGISVNK